MRIVPNGDDSSHLYMSAMAYASGSFPSGTNRGQMEQNPYQNNVDQRYLKWGLGLPWVANGTEEPVPILWKKIIATLGALVADSKMAAHSALHLLQRQQHTQ